MSAKKILTEAVECDQAGLYLQALTLYQDGIREIVSVLEKSNTKCVEGTVHKRVRSYIDRVEFIKRRLAQQATCGQLIVTKTIAEDAMGHGYEKVFGEYLNHQVKEILVQEPLITANDELQNVVNFLEVVVRKCPNLKSVRFEGNAAAQNSVQSMQNIVDIKTDMAQRGIVLDIVFNGPVEHTKVVLDNGYILLISPGLHYFKKIIGNFTLGLYDYNLRACEKTTISVYAAKTFED